jgi:photosystem II stability/assembly factor-like uncharacterized protein
MSEAVLLVGTRKGLWIGRSDQRRRTWEFDEPQFLMEAVYGVGVDTRGDRPRLYVSGTSEHWGPGVYYSDDLGRSWSESKGAAVRFTPDIGASVERVWQIQPGSEAEPGVVYAGTQPSALFRSEDRGETFELVRPLWDHPHREHWDAGYGGQAIHTIVPDGQQPDHLTVAMSTGGVYRTTDGGKSWDPANAGIKVTFLPDPYPEYGQCVHKVAAHPDRPDRMYAQVHHGVYRSDDAGEHWISIADGLPSDFGFPMVVHPKDPDTIYVFPLVADIRRIPPDGRARVWRSGDAGRQWTALEDGLPEHFYAAVMRDAFSADNADRPGLYFGSRDGCVYASTDDGEHWDEVAAHLPDVLSVRAVMA